MSYTPTTWKAGDTVTSAKLNKIEQGIANNGGILIVRTTYDEDTQVETCDHTWQEIYDAYIVESKNVVYVDNADHYITLTALEVDQHAIHFHTNGNYNTFYATSADDYPNYCYAD